MRFRSFAFVALILGVTLFLATPGFSQTGSEHTTARLVVTVVEYRADISPPEDASSRDIIALLEKESDPVRRIRIPTLSDCVASFQSGEQIGISLSTAGEIEFVEVGTVVQLTAKTTADSVLMNFDYSTSTMDRDDLVKSVPRVKEMTVQATYRFQLGEPVLFESSSATDDFRLVVTITEPNGN